MNARNNTTLLLSLLFAALPLGAPSAAAEEAASSFVEQDVLAPVGTSRARLAPEAAPEHLSTGGTLVTIPGSGAPIKASSGVAASDLAAQKEYREFLSRGSYSRTRSIGVSYGGGGGRSYSIGSRGARAVRTDYTESSAARRSSSPSGRFSINNGPVSLGRSSGGSFATIDSGLRGGRR